MIIELDDGIGNDGTVFVIFGNHTLKTLPVNFLLDSALNGHNGFKIKGKDGIQFGYAVGIGDFNGDGFADFVVGKRHFLLFNLSTLIYWTMPVFVCLFFACDTVFCLE